MDQSRIGYTNMSSLSIVFLRAVITGLSVICIFIMIMLCRAVFVSREIVTRARRPAEVLGRPLFFPVTVAHTRRNPATDVFHNRILLVGVPVGDKCHQGRLLSMADDSRSSMPWKSWFHFDTARYLHRGDEELSLEEKLHRFLRAQDLDPKRWPYAYLVSVPRWLWWSHGVLSWWYLYSPDRELDAVIMEINNFFGEKRNIFVQVQGLSPSFGELVPSASEDLDAAGLMRSLPSVPSSGYYKGSCIKPIYTTPFGTVDGELAARFCDPLQRQSWRSTVSFSNLTSVGSDGKTMVSARINCCESPLDPTRASAVQLFLFLIRWTLPGTLGSPQILYQALRIKYRGIMRMTERPVIRRGSLPRKASSVERSLEFFFRQFLAYQVRNFPDAIEVTYVPSRAWSDESICLRSFACGDTSDDNIRRVGLEPLDPGFFGRFIHYSTVTEGVATEMHPAGSPSDPEASNLWASDPTFILELLGSGDTAFSTSTHPSTSLTWRVLFYLRGSQKETTLDSFCRETMAPSLQLLYTSYALKDVFGKCFGLDWIRMLQIYSTIGVVVLIWLAYNATLCLLLDFSFWKSGLYAGTALFLGHVGAQVVTKL